MTRQSLPKWIAAAAIVLSSLLGPHLAWALPSGIYVTEKPADPKSASFEKDLKKNAKKTLAGEGGTWHVNFVAYLSKPAGSPNLNLVFYSVGGGKREQVNAFPIATQKGAKIVMSSVDVSPESGIKPGKYEVLVTELAGGKEIVYARSQLELK